MSQNNESLTIEPVVVTASEAVVVQVESPAVTTVATTEAPQPPVAAPTETAYEENGAKVVLTAEGATVNGIAVSPLTHVFRNSRPVLRVDGSPKIKPGPKTHPAQLEQKPARAPRKGVILVHEVPVVLGEKLDPAEQANTSEAMKPVKLAAQPAPVQPPAKRVQAPLTVTVQKAYGKIGAMEGQTETLEVRTFAAPPAQVELGYGLTLNIGNYESARVDVKISVPCYREETDAAYEWARGWAEERMRREVNEIKNIAGNTKPTHF